VFFPCEASVTKIVFAPAARAMLRFTRELIALRKRHPSLRRKRFFADTNGAAPTEIRWYGEDLEPPDWHDAQAKVLCFTLAGVAADEPTLHVMINMASTVRMLPLPDSTTTQWRRIADTTLIAPDDVTPNGVTQRSAYYTLGPHGVAIFEAAR